MKTLTKSRRVRNPTEYSELIRVLNLEISWCKRNDFPEGSKGYRKGFIKGLRQAKLLAQRVHQYQKQIKKESQ